MSLSSRQKSQWIVASVLGAIGLGAFWMISQVLNSDQGSLVGLSQESGVSTTIIADRTRAASPEMSWINNASTRVDELTADVRRLENALRTSQSNSERQYALLQEQSDEILAAYEAKIVQLEQTAAGQQAQLPQNAGDANLNGLGLTNGNNVGPQEFLTPTSAPRVTNPLGNFGQPGAESGGTVQTAVPGVGGSQLLEPQPFARDFQLASSPVDEEDEHAPHLFEYLPAGSYAPAVVLSGVDASTAVTSQAEPVPVIFRITGPAVTAGTRTTVGHTIDLTGCTVTGSARGDLSSERVYVRLLKLSCVYPGTHVFETDVAGYMSGAGKAGARGHVVSREGPLVRNAGIAGALAGLAEGVSSISQAGVGSDEASFAQALQGAGAASVSGGISGAADRLSEYYIERAEQYQPVVSLYGGTNVELGFLEGVDLG